MSQPPNDHPDQTGRPAGEPGDQPTYGQPTYGHSPDQTGYGQTSYGQAQSGQRSDQPQYGQQPAQQPGWSQPSAAQYGTDVRQTEAGYAQMYGEKPRTGMAITSLVLGIIAFLLAWFPIGSYLAVLLALLSVIFGIIAIRRPAGKGMAVAGLILGGLALVISIIASVVYTKIGADLIEITQQCIDETGTDQGPALEQCINDRGQSYNPFD
ncbi:MAG: DUF4190 domain-containing protein [Actinomycetes bacterium]